VAKLLESINVIANQTFHKHITLGFGQTFLVKKVKQKKSVINIIANCLVVSKELFIWDLQLL